MQDLLCRIRKSEEEDICKDLLYFGRGVGVDQMIRALGFLQMHKKRGLQCLLDLIGERIDLAK